MADWKDGLVRGKQNKPPRLVIYGGHGIGKSTLGNSMPSPIFISTEEGLDELGVNAAFPKAEALADVSKAIGLLAKSPHDFKTCVLDSADWLVEPLIERVITANNTPQDLAYGKGQVLIAEEFRNVLTGFDTLRNKRGMNIVIIAHGEARRYEDPLAEPYDRFEPKLPKRCNALLQEWADAVAFASLKTIIKSTTTGFNNKARRATTNGDRQLFLNGSPAFSAKSRYPGVPDTIDLRLLDNGKTDIEELAKFIPIVGLEQA